jgi:hypothetical protein
MHGLLVRRFCPDLFDAVDLTDTPPPVTISGWVGLIIEMIIAGYLDRFATHIVAVNSGSSWQHSRRSLAACICLRAISCPAGCRCSPASVRGQDDFGIPTKSWVEDYFFSASGVTPAQRLADRALELVMRANRGRPPTWNTALFASQHELFTYRKQAAKAGRGSSDGKCRVRSHRAAAQPGRLAQLSATP